MTWRLALTVFTIGFVGMLVALGGWHLWTDHQHIDAVWQLELQRAAQAQSQSQAK